MLDDSYRKQLTLRKYVSPSHDRQINLAPKQTASEGDTLRSPATNDRDKEADSKSEAERSVNDHELELDQDDSDQDEVEIPEGSLFDYNVPGILTKEEVSKLDLAHWKLLVRTSLIELEDLRGWEDWQVDDPASIKGIVAECIAATGPALLQNSALVIF